MSGKSAACQGSTATPRRRRSDAGQLRCSARDLELLGVVGEQYAISLVAIALADLDETSAPQLFAAEGVDPDDVVLIRAG
jgi:hypothetical protein